MRNSPASSAKLQQGDIVVNINGKLVTSLSTLTEQIKLSKNHINLRVIRPSDYAFGKKNAYIPSPPYQEHNIQVPIKNDC